MTASIRRHLVVALVLLLSIAGTFMVTQRATAVSQTPVVYVATGENFPDALGAAPAAAMIKGPILLVRQNSIPGETAAELTRLAPDKIIIVGGTAVISASVESGLAAYAGTVERIAGANRYDTAAQLSAATYPATFNADTVGGKSASALTSDGYSVYHDAAIDVPTTLHKVLSLTNLPAGSYVIIAKTSFFASSQHGVRCRLYADAQFDEVSATVETGHFVPASFTVVNTFASNGGVAELRCEDGGGGPILALNTKITAISVDGLSNHSG